MLITLRHAVSGLPSRGEETDVPHSPALTRHLRSHSWVLPRLRTRHPWDRSGRAGLLPCLEPHRPQPFPNCATFPGSFPEFLVISCPIPWALWETEICGSPAGSSPQTCCSSDTGGSLVTKAHASLLPSLRPTTSPRWAFGPSSSAGEGGSGAGTQLPSSTKNPCPCDLRECPWEKSWHGPPPR